MSGIEEGAAVGGAGGAGAGAGTAATTAGTAGAAGAAGGGALSTILQSLGLGSADTSLGVIPAGTGTVLAPGSGTGVGTVLAPTGALGGQGGLGGGILGGTPGAGLQSVLGAPSGPGILGQIGNAATGLGKGAVEYAKTNPLKTATGTFDAYKQLREELKPGPLAPLPARQPQQPLVGPNLVGQGGGAGIMSPAQRLQIIMQQMQGAPGQ